MNSNKNTIFACTASGVKKKGEFVMENGVIIEKDMVDQDFFPRQTLTEVRVIDNY